MSKNLQRYLDERFNFWRVNIDKKPALAVDTMTLDDANKIAESLVCDFSPENLTCDGELSRSQVQARASLYRNAAYELARLFPDLTKPQWDDGLFDAPPSVDKSSFIVGATVHVNHPQLGGRVTGKIVKVNRVKCLVDFSGKRYHVPMGMIETV